MKKVLTGIALALAAASYNRDHIDVRDVTARHKVGEANAQQMMLLLGSGRVEAVGRGKRLRYLRALDPTITIPRVPGVAEDCWRNTQAAVAWPWVDGRGVAA